MKKTLLFLLVIVAGMALPLQAQKGYEEVVYLKNGSIIRGVIIEQVPNETLKIKTRDGSVFVFKIDETEKITKEESNTRTNYDDVVYLKNGSVIQGTIIEQVLNEKIKIKTHEGNIFVYNTDEIEKFAKEESSNNKSANNWKLSQSGEFNKPIGYLGLVEFGGGIGFGTWGANHISLTMINGFRTIPQFAIGVGIGLQLLFYEYYDGEWDAYLKKTTEASLPIFLHLRSDFLARKISPFIAFNIGCNVSLSGGFFDGLMLAPTFGVSFNVGGKRMTVGTNCAINHVRYSYEGKLRSSFGYAFCVKVGYSF